MDIIFPLVYFMGWLSFLSKNRHLKSISILILGVIVFIFMGWSRTADFNVYQSWYEAAASYNDPFDLLSLWGFWGGRDKGYAIFNNLFAIIGMDFESFRVIYAFIYLSIMALFINKITRELLLVGLLYIVWPFFIDTIQIRTAIVHLMVFISLYLFSRGDKKDIVMAIFVSILATTVQILAVSFLPFYFFYKFHNNRFLNKILLVWVLIMPVIYVSPIISIVGNMINNFTYFTQSDALGTLSTYTLGNSSIGKFVYWINISLMLIITYFMKKISSNKTIKIKTFKQGQIKYFEVCYAFSLYLTLFLPLLGMSGAEVGRIPRCFMLSFITAVVLFITNNRQTKINIFILGGVFSILIMFGVLAFYSIPESFFQIIIENPIFNALGL